MTKRLEYLVANWANIPAAVKTDFTGGSLHPAFPPSVRDLLKGSGYNGAMATTHNLEEDEVKHMEEWEAVEKDNVRLWINSAVAAGQTVRFRWELHREPGKPGKGDYAFRALGPPVTITFRTYAERVKLSGQFGGLLPPLASIAYT
jgi:hypothetical protein